MEGEGELGVFSLGGMTVYKGEVSLALVGYDGD
jgi:hypothetical protein